MDNIQQNVGIMNAIAINLCRIIKGDVVAMLYEVLDFFSKACS
jgi:hypothetical protein